MSENKFHTKLVPIITGILPSLEGKDKLIQKVLDNFEYFLQDMDEDTRKKLSLLTSVIHLLAFGRNLHPLKGFTYEEKEKFFKWLLNFPVKMITAGFVGLRSLILISYYSLSESWEEIDYEGPIVKRELK